MIFTYHSYLSFRCLQLLLKYASNLAPLNERNTAHETPLHKAVLSHRHNAIIMLLNTKVCGFLTEVDTHCLVSLQCDLGISDANGQTPLHHAVQQNCRDCAQPIVTNAVSFQGTCMYAGQPNIFKYNFSPMT